MTLDFYLILKLFNIRLILMIKVYVRTNIAKAVSFILRLEIKNQN